MLLFPFLQSSEHNILKLVPAQSLMCVIYHHTECSSLAYRGWAIISASDTFLPKIMEWCILLFREIYIWWCNRHCTVSSAFVIVLELYLSRHLTPRPRLLSAKQNMPAKLRKKQRYYSLKRKLKKKTKGKEKEKGTFNPGWWLNVPAPGQGMETVLVPVGMGGLY